MKRSPLPRGTKRISRGTPLISGGALKPGTKGLKRSELVAKRPTVTPEERRARRIVKARPADGLCERCGRRPGTDYCHRKGAAQLGGYCPSNAWWGCRPCHTDCHLNPAVAYEQGWHVRSTQNPAVVPMWMAGRGLVLLRADGSVIPYNREAA